MRRVRRAGLVTEVARLADVRVRHPPAIEPANCRTSRSRTALQVAENNRDGASWGVTEVGLLATLLLSVENQIPIIKGGQFVEQDGELTLVASCGTGSEIKLVNHVQGSVRDGNGGVRMQGSLVTLARNGWLEIEHCVGEIRIRPGKNAKKLRSPEEWRTS